MSEKNYYDWLDLDKASTQHQIQESYIAQATKWHPLKNAFGKSRCTKAFLELSEAYLILSTPDLKSIYDTAPLSNLISHCKSYNLNNFTLEDALAIYDNTTRTLGMISVCLQNEKWHENNEIFTGGLLRNNYGRFVLNNEEKSTQDLENCEKYVKTVMIERDGRRVRKTITTVVRQDGSKEVVEEEKEEPLF
jgi:hypothetical protein